MQLESIQQALAGLPIADLRYYPSTGSTNEDALVWATEGAKDGSLVAADQQTSGRGRQGRKWVTNPGAGLAVSFIFKPTEKEAQKLQLFSPLGAVAVCQAIRKKYRLPAEVKWPNDILVSRKKTGGVLAETRWLKDRADALVLGIGVNLTPAAVPQEMNLRFPATCLESEAGQAIDRLTFLRTVCQAVFDLRPMLTTPEFIDLWEELMAFKGEQVSMEIFAGEIITGMLKGIDPQGNLILQCEDGRKKTFFMGEVRLLPTA
jgi:BirA family biotin operon repressor/biotin-[acetyl-CoA-carboxylase] ligase